MSKYVRFETVGDLIDILQTLPRDTKIFHDNDNMEQRGYKVGDCINTDIAKFEVERRDTYDAFDGTPYSYDCITKLYDEKNIKEGTKILEGIVL